MTNLISITDVRSASGATESLISDADITAIITNSQLQVTSAYNIYTEPTKKIDIIDGSNSQDAVLNVPNMTKVNYPYIWKMLQLNVQGTDLDLEYIQINPERGTFRIEPNEGSTYRLAYTYKTRIKYLSAFMERSSIITESTTDTIAGDSIAIAVDDESNFTVGDWIVIEGADGNIEATKITATDTNEITVNNLVQSHESESVITVLKTEECLKQFVLYDVCTNVSNYIIGNTSNVATGYTYPEYSVQKGVPYTHWRESAERFGRKRDEFKKKIELKLCSMS
jgi:uncharacterized protein YqfB (UPF0267 family)